ncbi:hypothetical protein CKO11_14905 [Rhodobacter sp. TJ_12]|uniref:spike base protein, RCAP_Rcc01079 family n=1 Tax=Rhodobacter sp. TJ_12 TaxID=2029399 RepID=UPI001CBA83C7|nr:hypothetical protein [Rhodobacter sp. TJ_12]MBZ4023741.1 hypothetical protein [Rhodobacter sp. TJ_12]
MSDPFAQHSPGVTGPALGHFVITPDDNADLPQPVRQVIIGGSAGTISYIHARDGQTYTTGNLPVGAYSIWAKRILDTGTTAAGLTGAV